MLKLENLQKADDRPYVDVHVPEWDGEVRLKALSLDQEIQRSKGLLTDPQTGKPAHTAGEYWSLSVALAMVNEDGSPFFEDAEVGQRLLLKRSANVVRRLYEKLNELTKASDEELAALEKKLKETAGTNSPSRSPSRSKSRPTKSSNGRSKASAN